MLEPEISGLCALFDDAVPMLIKHGAYFSRPVLKNLASYHNHQVAGRQSMLVSTKTLPKNPLQRIPFYSGRNLLSCQRESKARISTCFLSDQNRYASVTATNIVLKYLLKIDRTCQSQPSGKRLADTGFHLKA